MLRNSPTAEACIVRWGKMVQTARDNLKDLQVCDARIDAIVVSDVLGECSTRQKVGLFGKLAFGQTAFRTVPYSSHSTFCGAPQAHILSISIMILTSLTQL